MASISEKEFDLLSNYIMNVAGIQLDKGKEYLMEARLEPIIKRFNLTGYTDLYQKAVADSSGKFKTKIIDAITINETFFFRDNTPFDLLRNKIVPDLIDLKSKTHGHRRIPIRIWSAACSTGQEVYSLAIMLKEMFIGSDKIDLNIVGTDISGEAVAAASYGKYNQFEVERGLTSYHLNKYFTKVSKGWRIKDEIRSMAKFDRFDLNQPFHSLGKFDVVLCRNVAIYFPMSGKQKLFQKIAQLLNPGGALLVGGSESLAGIANDFIPRHYLNGVFYQQRNSESKAAPVAIQPIPKPIAQPQTIQKTIPTPRPRPAVQKQAVPTQPIKPQVRPASTPKPSNPVIQPAPPPPSSVPAFIPSDDTQQPSFLLATLGNKKSRSSNSLLGKQGGEVKEKVSLLQKLREKEEKEEE